MPNWTYNYVEIEGKKDVVLGIKDMLRNDEDEKAFDFNKVLPMPESLNIEEGSNKTPSVMHYLYTEKGGYIEIFKDPECIKYLNQLSIFVQDPESLIQSHQKTLERASDERSNLTPETLYSMGKQYVSNIKNHGCATWYDWCCNKWGTKWNSCEDEFCGETENGDDLTINYRFDTAWAMPYGIYERLHELYPEVKITVTFCDEDQEEDSVIVFGGEDS